MMRWRASWATVVAFLAPLCVAVYATTCPGVSPNCPWPTSGADPTDCGECEWAGVTGQWDALPNEQPRYIVQPCCNIHTIHCPGWYYHFNNRYTDYTMLKRTFYCEPPDGNCDNDVRDDGSTTCTTIRVYSSREGECCEPGEPARVGS